MRRNNAGRRSVRGPGPGPLMTGHLKDIDLELELLKRKREMIEQQQQLLMTEQQFNAGRRYDQLRFNEPQQHGSDRDFTHLYENRPNQNQFGRKRQAEPQWQYDGSFKRNTPKKKTTQFSPRQGPRPRRSGPTNFQSQKPASGPAQSPKNAFAPVMGGKGKPSIGQRIANQKQPPRPQKEFAPTKVSKPKASPGPNKVASQPVAERKALVASAKEWASQSDVSRMLLPDRVPTQQVSGRLELALGAIMKHVRDLIGEDSPNSYVLRSMQLQRVMKQAIRERIRTVMLGKVVGSLMEILAVYREEFPEETDADIVNLALEAAGVASTEQKQEPQNQNPVEPPLGEGTVKNPSIDDSFKHNINSLIDGKLKEMFDKLEEIYSNANTEDTEASENVTGEQNTEQPKDGEEKAPKTEEPADYKEFLNMDIKVRDVVKVIPRFLRKYTPYLIKLINQDKSFRRFVQELNSNAPAVAQTNQNDNAGESQKQQNNLRYTLPYYVKVMGKPSLPKRKVMQNFLNQFNPKSIKKHRTIHNLLFVGFSEMKEFDDIVAADGTVIGRSTLSIRICTNSTTGPMEETALNNTDVSMTEAQNTSQNSETKSEEDTISSDLDGQITDLLSSIRKEADESFENLETAEVSENAESTEKADGNDDAVQEEALPADGQEPTKESEAAEATEETEEIAEETNENQQDLEPMKDPETNGTEDTDEKTDNLEGNNEEAKIENDNTNSVEESNDSNGVEKAENDKVAELKSNAVSGRSTPTRASARLTNVTPSSIRTRRASRLNQN